MNTLHWQIAPFASLTLQQLYAILRLRQEVFVVEQTCPYLDADGEDQHAIHLWAEDAGGKVVAYARLFLPDSGHLFARIGRVLTSASVRRQGVGIELMQRAIDWLEQQAPSRPIRLAAQVYLLAFYKSFNFMPIGDEYLEDDIPHQDMERGTLI